MKFIIDFIKKFFPKVFDFLGKYTVGLIAPFITPVLVFIAGFFKKIGILLLIIAAHGAAIGLIAGVFTGLFATVAFGFSSDLLDVGRMFLPSNIPQCLSVLIVARIQSLIFYWVTTLSEKLVHT